MTITYKKQLYANNASTTLSSPINTTDVTISVVDGSRFPALTSGSFFLVTLDNGTNIEIVEVYGRSGNSLTGCVRGREGTSAQGFLAGTKVENRVTASTLSSFARLADRLTPAALLTDLVGPASVNNNSYVISQVDDTGAPILAVAGGGKWRFVNYPFLVRTQAAGATASTNSVDYTGTSLVPQFSLNGMILQFTTGQNAGMCRMVSEVNTTTLSWGVGLPFLPAPTDTYEVYQSTGSLYGLLRNSLRMPVVIDLGTNYDTVNSLYDYGD